MRAIFFVLLLLPFVIPVLVDETYEPEQVELEPVKEEKKGFFDWLFALFG